MSIPSTESMLPQLPDNSRTDAERRRHQSNKGRLAMVGQRFNTKGQGTFQFTKKVDFGMTFIRKPFLSYAAEIDPDEIREAMDLAESDELPQIQSSGYAVDWDTTTKGMYVGAWVAVSVSYVDPTGLLTELISQQFNLVHHFSFHEVALKAIGSRTLADPLLGEGDSAG